MARLASQIKGGYYPTPTDELSYLLPHITFSYTDTDKCLNIIDPCCGDGRALQNFGDRLKTQVTDNEIPLQVETFGVELEENRAKSARLQLDRVLCESYDAVRTEQNYGMMYLNPPYDDFDGERLEYLFLRKLTNPSTSLLRQKGLLLFVIPQKVLKQTASLLAKRFSDIQVHRFSDNNFSDFNQIVVSGYYKKSAKVGDREVADQLRAIGLADPATIPSIERFDDTLYIPASDEPVKLFRAGIFRPEEMTRDLNESTLTGDFFKRVTAVDDRAIMKRPILPLKATHAGIAVAAGAIGGNMGNHIVTGITKETSHTEAQYDSEGNHYGDKVSKFYSSVVRAYTPDGVFELK